jgi:MFS family permease
MDPLAKHTPLPVAQPQSVKAALHDLQTAVQQLKGKPIGIFAACFTAWALATMDQSLFSYAIPGILTSFHVSLEAIGFILSIGFGTAIFGAIAMGVLTDRYGRRISLALCLGLSGLLVGLQAFANSALILGIVRALAFAAGAGLSPITNAYVAESAPARIRGIMVGLLQCGYPLGWFAASVIVAPLMTHYGWRSIFIVAFVVVPVAAVFYAILPESRHFTSIEKLGATRPNWRQDVKELFFGRFRRQTLLCGLAFFAQGGAFAGSAFYLPTFFHEVRGYSEALSTQIVGLSYAIGIIGYIGASLIGEFLLTRRNTSILWCWTGAVAFVAFIWLPQGVTQDIIGYGCTAIFFYGAVAIMTTYLLDLFPTRLRATGAATGSAFLNLGFAIFPVLVAYIVGFIGWKLAFSVTVAPSLFICGIAMLGLDDLPSGREVTDI